MKTKININRKDLTRIGIAVVAGLFFGWLFFHGNSNQTEGTEQASTEASAEKATIWTCSMHPQVRLDHPGKCPICGMDLIPLTEAESEGIVSPNEIAMSEDAMKIAEIQTVMVKRGYPDKEVSLLGKIKPDERNIAELTARFGGRIEKLMLNFTGQYVRKGQRLAVIYSPELVTAQKELLEAMEYKESNPAFYQAARSKLKLWDLSDAQIEGVEKEGKPQNYFDVLSPISGTVTKRQVSVGDYIKTGSPLFEVIDLSHMWVMFEAYESDLPWISMNDRVNFTVQSLPGETFQGKVTYIDPFIDPQTRVASIRVEVSNSQGRLKPEMFANGVITSRLAGQGKDLMVPKTAVLWTGKRSVVYVKVPDRQQPTFLYREITLGPSAGDFYVVKDGLHEGEEIATNGVFKIDASAQLAGKPSMMNPAGGESGAGKMPGMDMGNGSKKASTHQTAASEETKVEHPKSLQSEESPQAFQQQLTAIYKAYIGMKDAFVASDATQVAQDASKVKDKLGKVDMELLSGDAHMQWMKQLNVMKKNISDIASSKDIAAQRKAFASFSDAFYHSIKAFGLENTMAYYQFCPMANNNKGAYWVSNIKEIKNPYFGEAMLTCGETRDTI
jgi:Cu(I)/Ag(I) efflux system membrane fusion protein